VVLRPTIVVGQPPLRGDVALLLQLQQCRVERAVVHREELAARLLDAARDAVSVQRAEGFERFEDHQGEGALPDVGLVAHARSYGKTIASIRHPLWEYNRRIESRESRVASHESRVGRVRAGVSTGARRGDACG